MAMNVTYHMVVFARPLSVGLEERCVSLLIRQMLTRTDLPLQSQHIQGATRLTLTSCDGRDTVSKVNAT